MSSAFRLLRRSSGSALWPSHDGIRRMRRTNLLTRPCRKTYGRNKDSNGLASSIVPAGDIAPPVGGIHVFSCGVLLCTTRCEIRHDERHKCALTAKRTVVVLVPAILNPLPDVAVHIVKPQ